MKLITLMAIGTLMSLSPAVAQESTPTTEEIVDALLPTGMDGRKVKGARSLDGKLRNDRGVKVIDGKEVSFIDIRVKFEYDSDKLSNDAMLSLQQLGKALTDEKLEKAAFRIVGHTDARGTEEYNQDLSWRRARAVTQYLQTHFNLPQGRIEVSGKGESELREGLLPEDARNRRVEVQSFLDATE